MFYYASQTEVCFFFVCFVLFCFYQLKVCGNPVWSDDGLLGIKYF